MGKTIGERAMDVSLRAIGSGVAAKELAAALRELREDIAQAIQKQCVYLSLDETVAHIRKIGEPEPEPPVIEHDTFTKALQDQVMRVLIPRLYPNLMVLDATPEEVAKDLVDGEVIAGIIRREPGMSLDAPWKGYLADEVAEAIRAHVKPMPTKETR